jgi:hypothetical protein
MNWQIIFSTYINKTGNETGRLELEDYLVKLAEKRNIQGFSLSNQTGFWAGVKETSYNLTLFDISKQKAFELAREIKNHFEQDSVIIKPIEEQVYFI